MPLKGRHTLQSPSPHNGSSLDTNTYGRNMVSVCPFTPSLALGELSCFYSNPRSNPMLAAYEFLKKRLHSISSRSNIYQRTKAWFAHQWNIHIFLTYQLRWVRGNILRRGLPSLQAYLLLCMPNGWENTKPCVGSESVCPDWQTQCLWFFYMPGIEFDGWLFFD